MFTRGPNKNIPFGSRYSLESAHGKLNGLPCDGCVWDEFCDDNDGRYGGRLIFDNIFTDDELRLFELFSPVDDGESFILAFLCLEYIQILLVCYINVELKCLYSRKRSISLVLMNALYFHWTITALTVVKIDPFDHVAKRFVRVWAVARIVRSDQ